MCDPVSIAGAVLMAGGTAATAYGNSQAQQKRDDVLAAERIRQRKYDQESDALNKSSRELYDNFTGKQSDAASSLASSYTTAVDGANATAGSLIPASSSNIVNSEVAKQNSLADAYVAQQGDALANLRSFGSVMGDNSRQQARNASLIAQIGNFKQGSANASQIEAEQAAKAGSGWNLVGDLASGLGSLGMSAGLSGATKGLTGKLSSSLASLYHPTANGTGATYGVSPYSIY